MTFSLLITGIMAILFFISSRGNESKLITPVVTEKPVNRKIINILINYKNIEKIEDQYRYYFEIKNNSSAIFKGHSYIDLFKNNLIKDYKIIRIQSLEPFSTMTVYVDSEEKNVDQYRFKVYNYVELVNKGRGEIN